MFLLISWLDIYKMTNEIQKMSVIFLETQKLKTKLSI